MIERDERFWSLINQDILQYISFSEAFSGSHVNLGRKISAFFIPALLCCFLFRLAHWFYRRELKTVARLLCRMNYFLHKVDISPSSEIGGGLYIPHTVGIIFNGRAGKNLTLYALAVVGSGSVHPDRRAVKSDCPELGDNVMIGACAVVTGAIEIGSNCKVGANCIVQSSVPDNAILYPGERTVMKRKA